MSKYITTYPTAVVNAPRPVRPDASYGYTLAGLGVTTMMPFIERDEVLWADAPPVSYAGETIDVEVRNEGGAGLPGEGTAKNFLLYLGVGAVALLALSMAGKRRRA